MKKLFTILAVIALTAGSIGLSSARQSQASKVQAESVAVLPELEVYKDLPDPAPKNWRWSVARECEGVDARILMLQT